MSNSHRTVGGAAWVVGLVLWVASLIVASPWDLPLSRAVADASSAFGRLVSWAGELPGWGLIACSLVMIALAWRGGALRSGDERARLGFAVVLLAVINPLLVTQGLKLLWGRVRYCDLGGGGGFTPFYLPAGPGAGESFPSGHTAMAFVWAPVPYHLWPRRPRAALAAWLAGLAYGVAVAWGRILYGKHFLTDVVFAAGLGLLLGPLVLRLTDRGARTGRPGPPRT